MKPHFKFRFLLIFFLLISVLSLSFNGIAFAHDKEQQSTFASPILVVNTSFLNIRTGPSAGYSILVTAIGGTELPVLGVAKDLVWYQVATDAGVGWVNVTFTLPRGDFSHVPLATVTETPQTVANLGQGGGFAAPTTSGGVTVAPVTSGVGVMGVSINGGDMYAAPDPNAAVVRPAAGIDYSRIFPVLDVAYVDGRPFYKVFVPEWGIVWNDRFRVRPMACNGLSVLVIRDEQVGTLPVGVSPSFTLKKGDEAYVVGNGFDGLIEIQTMDGSRGLVPVEQTTGRPASEVDFCNGVAPSSQTAGGVVTTTNTTASLGQGGGGGGFVQPAITAAARVIVNTGNLNIRSGPSAGYSIVVTVPGGTELAVLGVYKDGVWYLVQGTFGQGWLNIEYVIARGDFSRVPLVKEPVVLASNPVANLGQGGGFAAPTTSGGVAVAPVTSGVGVMGVSINGGDMYAAPDPNAAVVRPAAGIDYSRIFPVLDVAYVDGRPFYKVFVPEWGIVWNDRFRVRPMACNGLSVLVIRDEQVGTLPVGVSPSFTLKKGDEAYVVGNGFDGLIEIQTMDGSRGLVPVEQTTGRPASEVDFCNGVAPSSQTAGGVVTTTNTTASLGQGGGGGGFVQPAITAAARVIINTGNLNIRTGPSASFSVVATVSGGTELAVLGVADDGVWYLVQGTFGQGWLNNEFVIFRGDYSSVPVLNINP